VCDLTPDLLVTFSASLAAPSEARTHVRKHGCPEHGALALDALLLITSELVTNAVQHGRPPIVFRLSCLTSEIRLSVSDEGPELPREQGTRGAPHSAGRLPRVGGLGLVILDQTSREWGTTPLATGKEVWSFVPTGPPRRGRTPALVDVI
jgi:anti-sigma regulatory factor (Ser/Thr protein kinase)